MTHVAKNIIKQFIPPIFFRLRKYFQAGQNPTKNIFSGNYDNWNEAVHVSSGYGSSLIFEKVKAAALAVKNREAVFERDSVLFHQEEYNWPLLALLLRIAGENDNRLTVLDFGGSLGSTYFQHRKMLDAIDLSWQIVEQPHFVEFGKQALEETSLHFYFSIEEAVAAGKPDVILLSSVLPYLEAPYKRLDQLSELRTPDLVIDRTPFLENARIDRLTVQKVAESIYPATYPAWFFSKERFDAALLVNGYVKRFEFPSLICGNATIQPDQQTAVYQCIHYKLQQVPS